MISAYADQKPLRNKRLVDQVDCTAMVLGLLLDSAVITFRCSLIGKENSQPHEYRFSPCRNRQL